MQSRVTKSFNTRVERKKAEREAKKLPKFFKVLINIIKGYTLFKGGINLLLVTFNNVSFIIDKLIIVLKFISSNLYYVKRNDLIEIYKF
ncbi:hypothetical protein CKN99_12520 [Carnobacterium maltaromaticum]|uniref:hypothetical protein n=1 Tax=Carnobacterium maltaromaticum TaxID=2751 RepID=UPI00107184C5|nr:hypothetical protein [Carnobacterium maltaromaticum]MDT1946417.1 hypothetical protein [Carnobacterium maltaromaticum]MDT2000785.1 hypothetical protein [Carnobacterium maltaromaticum]TFJ25407.1 hypothetical protein CKN90_12480 [Carnobacterium maltaromaticum]TFJ30595.1 hypothetical protein CKN98_12485 [Carnobacterium maltaromaticum]TFJ33676.1 hypothetical protein CKN88_12440 [Carnobacterium maltaromaticum]